LTKPSKFDNDGGLMPCATPAPPVKPTVADKLARIREKIAANPSPNTPDSEKVREHKLAVFKKWADLRRRALKAT